jgi:threonine dehydrogenase-like Zn-dependent dehydrogenase
MQFLHTLKLFDQYPGDSKSPSHFKRYSRSILIECAQCEQQRQGRIQLCLHERMITSVENGRNLNGYVAEARRNDQYDS